jgi:ERCC4-type nuclease
MAEQSYWVIKKTGHLKFPYRLTIVKGGEELLDLFVQDKWPGTKGNIFCIQTAGREAMCMAEEEIERVPVVGYSHFGKRITVILDRAINKRCSFLFLMKSYKGKEGEYEQIFWQTQTGLTGHKSKYKLAYSRNKDLTIFTDTAERYAWNFPGAETVKEKLPIGDYAIKDDFGFLAVVERKTFNNLMGEFGNLRKFHQHLSELETCRNSALVVEANYSDFLNNEKIRPYTGNFGAKAIAEIQAAHPEMSFVFAGGRKIAIAWTFHYFQAIKAKNQDDASGASVIRSSAAKYGAAVPATYCEDEARRMILSQMPAEFTTIQLRHNLPKIKSVAVRRVLEKLKNEGVLETEKKGRDILWRRIDKG